MPNNTPTTFGEGPAKGSSTPGEKLAETASQLKEKASEFGRKAADKIDENLGSAATGLDKAAAALHERAEDLPGVNRVRDLTHTAADKLSATAECVREHDFDRIVADVRSLIKKNPGPSLMVAGFVGFLVGRAFRSHDVD